MRAAPAVSTQQALAPATTTTKVANPSLPRTTVAGTSRGHSLARVSTHPPAAAPARAEAPATTIVSSQTALPLQMLPNWKKLLAGTGAVLGTGALIAGGLMASPALAVAGGLGLLAGGGYLAKPAVDRYRNERRRERELREAAQSIRRGIGGHYEADDTSRSAVLSRVMTEASGHLDNPNLRLQPTGGRGVLSFSAGALNQRRYGIHINPDQPLSDFGYDPDLTRSTVLHELTHVAVDQSYTSNANRGEDDRPKNVRGDEDEEERDEANYQSVLALQGIARNDPLIPQEERFFVNSRLDYATSFANPKLEHDTVMNELLYYFHQKGIPEHSETSRGITRLAHEAYRRRRNI